MKMKKTKLEPKGNSFLNGYTAECCHVQAMREDDDDHRLWICRVETPKGGAITLLACDDCAAVIDAVTTARMPYLLSCQTLEELADSLKKDGYKVVPVSGRARAVVRRIAAASN
jgi:hypothetical protein